MEGPIITSVVHLSPNFKPPIWTYDYIQSLSSKYKEKIYLERHDMLKVNVQKMIDTIENPLRQLELVDVLQRLGLFYHFKDKLKKNLDNMYESYIVGEDTWKNNNLYATGLAFRVFRQYGYNISPEVFTNFQDEMGDFKAFIKDDIEGMLSLYEASYLSIKDEIFLDTARNFTTKHLKEFENKNKNKDISLLVKHALEFPLHWRSPRLEARWFINLCCKRKYHMHPLLLELAKLDFNIMQATYQEELKHASRWWDRTGLPKKLSFLRDRLMEAYIWQPEQAMEPQFGYYRTHSTRLFLLMTMVDDLYDSYGRLEELELFTDAIKRWDTSLIDKLPDPMTILFLTVHNFVNELAYEILRDQGFNIIPCLKKYWGEYTQAYLVEAQWQYNGNRPSLQEYLDNAWISIGIPLTRIHAYFTIANPIKKEVLNSLEEGYPNFIHWTAMLIRLVDDIGTFSRDLEVSDPNSISLYMSEKGISEEEARKYIRCLIDEAWKMINGYRFACSPFPQILMEMCVNFSRLALCVYQHGDGYTSQADDVKDIMSSLLIDPIPLQ